MGRSSKTMGRGRETGASWLTGTPLPLRVYWLGVDLGHVIPLKKHGDRIWDAGSPSKAISGSLPPAAIPACPLPSAFEANKCRDWCRPVTQDAPVTLHSPVVFEDLPMSKIRSRICKTLVSPQKGPEPAAGRRIYKMDRVYKSWLVHKNGFRLQMGFRREFLFANYKNDFRLQIPFPLLTRKSSTERLSPRNRFVDETQFCRRALQSGVYKRP
jgi:hypothetical protein